MACRDCEEKARLRADTGAATRLFAFPFGAGVIEVTLRGPVTREDVTERWGPCLAFVQGELEHSLPARAASEGHDG